jgi:Flp pilus assembly protein TadD
MCVMMGLFSDTEVFRIKSPIVTQNSTNPLEKRPWLGAAFIVLLGSLAYLNTFQVPFIYDDHNSITDNPNIQSLWPLSEAVSAPPQSTVAGRPVVSLTLAVNHAISGLEPWSYHAVNLLIHLGAGLLMWALIRCTARLPNAPPALTRNPVLWATALATIWTVHPLLTEAVTYVSTRTESLAGLFILATVYLASRGFDSARSTRWYAAATATAFLAMGSKETAAFLPLIVLAYDRVVASGSFREALVKRRGLYAGLAASWLLIAALVAGGHRSETVGYGLADISFLDYLRTQVGVIFHYLGLALWPHPLSLDYAGWTIVRATTPVVLAGGLVLLTLFVLSLRASFRGSWAGFTGLWFFLLLAPSSSVIPIVSEVAAERRMYLPLAAVVAVVLVGLWKLAVRFAGGRHRFVFVLASGVLAVGLALATNARNAVYESAESIWRSTVKVRPDNGRAHGNLGRVLAVQGRHGEAEEHLRRAVELDTTAVEARDNLANLLLGTGRPGEALRLLEEAVDLRPEDATTRIHLGNALLADGDATAAFGHFETAIRLRPSDAVAHSRTGSALAALGRFDEALAAQRRAVELDPNHVLIRLDFGKLLMQRGDPEAAAAEFRTAVELEADNVDARNNLAFASLESGHLKQAQEYFQTSLRIQPTATAHFGLARLDAAMGRIEDAEAHLRSGLQLNPNDAQAHFFLASIILDTGREGEAEEHFRAALTHRPGWGSAGNGLARLLATADDPEVRNPAESIQLAEGLCRASQYRHPLLLETLALAYSAAGRPDDARATALRGVEVARQTGADEVADRLLELYD